MRKKRLAFFLVSINILALIFASQGLAENQASKEKLSLGSLNSLSNLTRQGVKKESFAAGYSAGGQVKTLTFTVDTSQCFLDKVNKFDYIRIKNFSSSTKPGEPRLPVEVSVITLPKNSKVFGINVTSGQYVPILNKLNIVPVSQPVLISGRMSTEGALSPDKEIYSSYNFFPGEIVSYYAGADKVFVRFYPVQYIPKTKETILITSATVEVYYEVGEQPSKEGSPTSLGEPLSPGTACLIIYPSKYVTAATNLENFHEVTLGIETYRVTTESIDSLPYGETGCYPLTGPPDALCSQGGFGAWNGDKHTVPGWSTIKANYKAKLAQKICTYIQESKHSGDNGYIYLPDLAYIVLLGNDVDVPPSYYVYSHTLPSGSTLSAYESWIPTDFFYSLASYASLVPNFGVGRLSLRDASAAAVVNGGINAIHQFKADGSTSVTGDTYVYTGTVTAALTQTSFTDGAANWIPNEFAGAMLKITSDPGGAPNATGKTYTIASNTTNSLTIVSGTLITDGVEINSGYGIGDLRSELTVTVTGGDDVWIQNEYQNWNVKITSGVGTTYVIDFHPAKAALANGKLILRGDTAWDNGVIPGDTYEIRSTIDEAEAVVQKIINWYGVANNTWFKNVALAGGQTFDSWLYHGEMACLEIINTYDTYDNRSILNGNEVTKYFHTDTGYDEAFNEADVDPCLKDTLIDTGILYLHGHGSGNAFHFDVENISATEVLAYPASVDHQLPIVLSVACDNGAFDTVVYPPGYNTSFGESILLSGAGGIAYIGGPRSNFVSINYAFSETGVVSGSYGLMPEMLLYMFRQYHRSAENLRSMYTKGVIDYVGLHAAGLQMEDFYSERTLFGVTLLGDPVLDIPVQEPAASEYAVPGVTAKNPRANPPSYNALNIPVYEVADASTKNVTVTPTANSTQVEIKLVDPRNGTTDNKTIQAPAVDYTFAVSDHDGEAGTVGGPSFYIVRVSGQDEDGSCYTKEARQYVEVVNTFTPVGNILIVDDDEEDRYRFYTYPSNSPDYESYYINALVANGYVQGTDFKVWHVDNDDGTNGAGKGRHGEITPAALSAYKGTGKLVIWFTGDDLTSTLFSPDQTYLQGFLDAGGRLFITGQDIGWDIGYSSFYRDYLHATYVQDNIMLYNIDGVANDDISNGLYNIDINPGHAGGARNQHYPSEINVVGAVPCFIYLPGSGPGEYQSSGTAGIRYYTGNYAVVYFAFGFEGINDETDSVKGRNIVMKRVVDWLKNPTTGTAGLFSATAGDQLVTLNWTNPTNPSYKGTKIVYRTDQYPTSHTDGTLVCDKTASPGSVDSYVHTGLTNGITYYYVAYWYTATPSYTLIGYAAATPYAAGVPELGTPYDLAAFAGKNSVTLQWVDNSWDETGFSIARKTGTGGTYDSIATVASNLGRYGWVSYYDLSVEADVTYYYKVRSYKIKEETIYSGYSNEASATPYGWGPEMTSLVPGSGTGCFIATAAYGTPMAEEVVVLRKFRDNVLLKTTAGRDFVNLYYATSPPIAEFIRNKPGLKALIRVGLKPLVWLSKAVTNEN
ncbi:MAG TPA: hypothetical protein DHT43_03260 [Deltaproteobacteria bacterium]|nr:hypothetical protein [Deltaproteobacteria bacterium]